MKEGMKQDSLSIEQRLRIKVIGIVILGVGVALGLFGLGLGVLFHEGSGIGISKTVAVFIGTLGVGLFVTGGLMMEKRG